MLSQLSNNKPMPINLVIVRNGFSEGALALLQKDTNVLKKLGSSHNSKWRLTDCGKLQALETGIWLQKNFKNQFSAFLTGEYIRSLETAAGLKIPNAKWLPSLYLRPRDFGSLADFNRTRNENEIAEQMAQRERDSFYWTPPHGESIAHLTLRTRRIIHWIKSHVPSTGSVLIVTHKDVMETFRIRIERISQMEYKQAILHPPRQNRLNHCSIIHYTRQDPITKQLDPHYKWMRIITPWMGKDFITNNFSKIVHRTYSNEELLAQVSIFPHLFQ